LSPASNVGVTNVRHGFSIPPYLRSHEEEENNEGKRGKNHNKVHNST